MEHLLANEHIFLHLALILIFSKIISFLSAKIKQPPVIGFIIFGLLMGPQVLNIIQPDVVIEWVSRVGVLLLLFQAGLETNLRELKKQGKIAVYATIGGVFIPFLGGFAIS
ncbi:MAG: cation:proton antiporter, partial [Candidatus Cloacimonadota bacterium]|nr:cation:proton antiporter [Candidatus Cloacimonadota bacterium]